VDAALAPLARAPVTTASVSTSSVPQGFAPVFPPRFGDSDPVDWPNRTPDAYAVHGIDLSRWQPTVDWPTARAHGVNFAFIKATEGGDHDDPLFAQHWRASAAAGVPRAAYHFFYFCRPAASQARWFIAHVPREPGALPPVLDLEWNHLSRTCPHRPSPEEVRAEARVFLDIVGAHYGQTPIVYTTPDFWEENELWKLEGVQPWLRAVADHPSQVYPGADWTFWQYSGTGRIPGIAGDVDLNAFRGSEGAWAAWLARNSL
jgi:lysozyme